MNVDSASDSGGREFFFPTLTKCFLIGINTFWEDFRSNVVGLLPYNTEWTSARKLIKMNWIKLQFVFKRNHVIRAHLYIWIILQTLLRLFWASLGTVTLLRVRYGPELDLIWVTASTVWSRSNRIVATDLTSVQAKCDNIWATPGVLPGFCPIQLLTQYI